MSTQEQVVADFGEAKERLCRDELLSDFLAQLRGARRPLLLLDYDGTLAPFTPDRDRARPYTGVREALHELMATTPTRIVLISGRSASDLPRLIQLDPMPEVWGAHGWERRLPEGSIEREPLPPLAAEALAEAVAWARRHWPATHIEQKASSIALHWRGLEAGERARLERLAREALQPLTRSSLLKLKPFDGGLELRVKGRDKGMIVRLLLAGPHDCVAYLGDDLTDEDAFAALSGDGLSVLVRPEKRDTRADLWIRPPGELLAFLSLWTEACTAEARAGNE